MNSEPFKASKPGDLLDLVDARCAELERRWTVGPNPCLEDLFSDVPPDWKEPLFKRLIAVDLAHRRMSGTTISEEELLQQYPEFVNVLSSYFREREGLASGDSRSRTLSSTEHWKRGPSAAAYRSKHQSGEMISRYRLVALLGHGGFGEVWRAADPELGRDVAIKLTRSDRDLPTEYLQRLRSEARKVASLRHPGIVSVFDYGTTENGPYIVSEFVQGETLADRVRRGQLPAPDAVHIAIQICDALHHAHLQGEGQGLVHRDVKPGNILLRAPGKDALLADFGLAVTETDQLQEPHGTVGTWGYMSPEQARGERGQVDARSDIFSLGVVLYQMLAGRLPYVAATRSEYVEQLLHRPPRPLRTIDDSLDEELERICLRCLAKDVSDRFTTAADVSKALRAWRDGQSVDKDKPTALVSAGQAAAPKKPSQSLKWLVAVACGLAAIAAAVKFWPATQAAMNLAGASRDNQPLPPNAADELEGWIPLLKKQPAMFAYSVGEGREAPRFDADQQLFAVRADGMQWIATAGELKENAFELKAEISVDNWVGCGGVVWQLAVDSRQAPKKSYHCFGVQYSRMTENAVPRLRLSEFLIDELSHDYRHIAHTGGFTDKKIQPPTEVWVPIKCRVTPERVTVWFGNDDEWAASEEPLDVGWQPAVGHASCGAVGFGKETKVRGLAVRYLQ